MTTAFVEPWARDDFAGENDGDGVTMSDFTAALSVWAWMNQRDITVAEAALAFNVSPDLVIEVVEASESMFFDDKTVTASSVIEFDGD